LFFTYQYLLMMATWWSCALLIALAGADAAVQTRRNAVTGGGQPLLRALRGGANSLSHGADLVWVRAPRKSEDDNAAPIQMVRSLAAFCEEHGLDEDAMIAVSRGEAADHEGWQCGVALEYDAPAVKVAAGEKEEEEEEEEEEDAAEVEDVPVKVAKGAKKRVTAIAEDDEDDEADASAAAAAAPKPPVQMNKMLIGMLAPMGVLRVLKRYDQKSAAFTTNLRAAFFAIIALNTLVQMLIEWRIKARKDTSVVTTPLNPIAMLMGGGANTKQTAMEYDQQQLKSMRSSYRMGCLFTCFLHFKMKMMQPVVYSSVSGLIDLYYNPLVQIYLLGQPAEGHNKRPFGAAPQGPAGANPFASLLNATAAAPGPATR
jgi:hypothetical protein